MGETNKIFNFKTKTMSSELNYTIGLNSKKNPCIEFNPAMFDEFVKNCLNLASDLHNSCGNDKAKLEIVVKRYSTLILLASEFNQENLIPDMKKHYDNNKG